ncbi:MAG: extracellular solute-binding protein, partial [Chloroflexi bacterium]|nr:extracellular solute-binding protein [Chloroflexota bacterium]
MRKLLVLLSLLGLLIGIPAFAQSGDACNIDAPAEPVTIEMISWPFAITEFYAAEMEACSEVDNLTINTNLLDSASLREQVALALSGGGDSPYDILHGANGQIADWGAPGWVMPLNDLIEKYWDEYDLGDIPQGYWDSASYNGNIYGVPVVGNTLHLVYRIDVFEENGWEVPDTYDDLLNWCDEVGLGNPDWE